MLVKLMWILALLATLTGCGEISEQYRKVVSPDEVVVTEVHCVTLITIPILCAVDRYRIITVHVEKVVTEIVETIVEVEVIREVIIEKIVTEIEIEHIAIEVDINDIVPEVVERIKALVPADDIRDIPLNKIVEEVTNKLIDEAPMVEEVIIR